MSKSVFAFDDVPFMRRLAETIAWCGPRARASDPLQSLRSEELRPSILERDRAATVRTVAGYRASSAREVPLVRDRESLAGGRLLVYFPDGDLACGAAEVESGGFFDVNNAPPWDTWIALADDELREPTNLGEEYVVAWVPDVLVPFATAGIEVNPEHCIAWIEHTEVRARQELRHLLLQ